MNDDGVGTIGADFFLSVCRVKPHSGPTQGLYLCSQFINFGRSPSQPVHRGVRLSDYSRSKIPAFANDVNLEFAGSRTRTSAFEFSAYSQRSTNSTEVQTAIVKIQFYTWIRVRPTSKWTSRFNRAPTANEINSCKRVANGARAHANTPQGRRDAKITRNPIDSRMHTYSHCSVD
ncbi:hypothetical protein EVAR_22192_1 [Eumeta japonica]|uniref:Uncharacterized protein n=1 Tax=Eumeta variegata TaxID=151549 RepID=A0A4C1UBL6_EUMVA|nr:hypothetical protein EVAR_22192_1 [Eumeta japonica]